MSINMTQKFAFETDSLDSLGSMLGMILHILFWREGGRDKEYCELHVSTQLPTLYRHHPNVDGEKRFFVCSVKDHKTSVDKDAIRFGTDTSEENFKRIVDEVFKQIEGHNLADLVALRGTGFNYGFNHMDGDIGLGFRLEVSPNCGWDNLDIYLVHAYYGK